MRGSLARVFGTAQLVFFALLPAADAAAASQDNEHGRQGRNSSEGTPPFAKGGRGGFALDPCQERLDETAGAAGAVLRCAPRQIRGGMGRLLNSRGELRLFFPNCLAIAAPVLLFRLKREGFSRCFVEASDRGLLVRGMR